MEGKSDVVREGGKARSQRTLETMAKIVYFSLVKLPWPVSV